MEPHNIKNARLKMQMTQQELGDAMGVTASQISKWESGKISMSKRYSIQLKDLFSSMILSPDEQANYLELSGKIPNWVEEPSMDPEQFQWSSDELSENERMLERREFVEKHRDDPPSEEEAPEVIENLMHPSIAEDGFEISGTRSDEEGEFITVRNEEGQQLNMQKSRFIQWRSEGVNPFDKWKAVEFSQRVKGRWEKGDPSKVQFKSPRTKKSGFSGFSNFMDVKPPTPETTKKEMDVFVDWIMKSAMEGSKPMKFDDFFHQKHKKAGGSDAGWGKLQEALKKIPEKQKESIMQEAFEAQNQEMHKVITEAFGTEEAAPLLKMISDKIEEGVADYQFAAKSEVARLEAMIQKEAKDKVMEYRKEIGVLQAALKEKDNTIQLLRETIELHKQTADLLKEQIQNHKAMAAAGIPEAIIGGDIVQRAASKTAAQSILDKDKKEDK